MDLWRECADDVTALDTPSLTVDQQLEILKIKALLSVAQRVAALPDALRQRD